MVGVTSCSDYLDIDPENKVPEEKVDFTRPMICISLYQVFMQS